MIGVRVGCWVIETEIGRGGMGAVYRARRAGDAGDGPPTAAVKVLAAELAVEVGFQQRFQREIDILRQLDHPHIVRLYDSGTDSNRSWYAMELVEGPSYERLLEQRRRIPWPEVLELAWQIAPALKHAHDRGVVHRDLKPSNLLRGEAAGTEGPGPIKLTDFGIAALFASPHLTVTGGVIGTPEYLSPEQATGKPVTRRSDLYALGVVLYTLVTGRTPFSGEPIALLHQHRFAQFDRPGRIEPTLHPDFEAIICSLLEKEPANRPGDAGVLFRQLDSLRRKIARQARETAPPSPQADAAETVRTATGSPGGRSGPATLMSRLMREELEAQNRPGPIARVLHHPFVLVVLFLLCVGTLVWTLWPSSPESLYRRGAALMASDDPHDWERGWDRYLEPLEQRFPDHPYHDEVEVFRRRLEARREEERAETRARFGRRISDGQWFYERGLRLYQAGDEAGARRVWQALVDAYAEVPGERPWARLAEGMLKEPPRANDAARYRSLRDAIVRVRQMRAEGRHEEAATMLHALGELYRDDPAALQLLKEP